MLHTKFTHPFAQPVRFGCLEPRIEPLDCQLRYTRAALSNRGTTWFRFAVFSYALLHRYLLTLEAYRTLLMFDALALALQDMVSGTFPCAALDLFRVWGLKNSWHCGCLFYKFPNHRSPNVLWWNGTIEKIYWYNELTVNVVDVSEPEGTLRCRLHSSLLST